MEADRSGTTIDDDHERRKTAMTYGFGTRMRGTFDETIGRVTAALKEEGFGILSDIDVQAAMREKLGLSVAKYRILGACNPPLAHRAMTAEPEIGLLLPCNVLVREVDDGVVSVSFIDPDTMTQLIHNPEVDAVAAEAKARLLRVRNRLDAQMKA
jgi:uncharacterized protein (DUF302 family)